MPRLNPGDPFPELTLSITDGQLTIVPDAFACDFGVVLFYPGAWCLYCSPQLGPSTSRPSPSDTAPSRRPSPPTPAPLSTLIRSVAAGLAEQSVDVTEGIWPLGGSGRQAHLVSSAGAVAAALAARTALVSAAMS